MRKTISECAFSRSYDEIHTIPQGFRFKWKYKFFRILTASIKNLNKFKNWKSIVSLYCPYFHGERWILPRPNLWLSKPCHMVHINEVFLCIFSKMPQNHNAKEDNRGPCFSRKAPFSNFIALTIYSSAFE